MAWHIYYLPVFYFVNTSGDPSGPSVVTWGAGLTAPPKVFVA